jgi:hypothetical protein
MVAFGTLLLIAFIGFIITSWFVLTKKLKLYKLWNLLKYLQDRSVAAGLATKIEVQLECQHWQNWLRMALFNFEGSAHYEKWIFHRKAFL